MMTISTRVHKAKKEYRCEDCKTTIPAGALYVRMFGSPDDSCKNPPPYEVMLCDKCRPGAIDTLRRN